MKKPGGFQPDLVRHQKFKLIEIFAQVCLTPWVNGEAPSAISCLTVNASFGLLAYGNGSGLVIVDFIQVPADRLGGKFY